MSAPRITVVGSINLDLVAVAATLPAPGETVTGAVLGRYPGGKGANQALAARRLGAEVRMIGRVWADAMADEALVLLRGDGVDLSAVAVDKALPTAVALIAVNSAGENQIVVASGANGAVRPEHLPARIEEPLIQQLEIPLDTVAAAVGRATGFVCLNLAPATAMPEAVLRRADLLVVNDLEAAFYGALSALIFTLLPLARTERIRPAALYRGGTGTRTWPRKRYLAALALLTLTLIGAAAWLSGIWKLALGAAGGVLGALLILALAAAALRWTTRRLARTKLTRGRPATRAALAAIGAPRSDATSVILSLGLGLSVLAAVGQIDWNLRQAIATDLPTRAPAFFFIDIQPDQLDPFLALMKANPVVTETETAPMLRGVITQINGKPAREVAGDHWVVRGDRGITYAASPGPKTRITAGKFWPEDYTGDPQISFAAEEAEEIGLKLGDTMTVNILGRDITATITSFREVDFSNAGMGFVMTLNPSALAGAPHSHIATVYAPPEAEAQILKDVTKSWPNITAIGIREAVDRVAEALSAIATATAWAAAGTLLTGFVVLIGAAAAGERARIYESAILKTLGATRGKILASFALCSALMGAAAGVVAVIAGGISGWAVMTFVMDVTYRFEPFSAIGIVSGGVLATLLAGLFFALRPLNARPAQTLRAQD